MRCSVYIKCICRIDYPIVSKKVNMLKYAVIIQPDVLSMRLGVYQGHRSKFLFVLSFAFLNMVFVFGDRHTFLSMGFVFCVALAIWNSRCRPAWSQTQRSVWLCPPSARLKACSSTTVLHSLVC